jgi:hypothetical protein
MRDLFGDKTIAPDKRSCNNQEVPAEAAMQPMGIRDNHGGMFETRCVGSILRLNKETQKYSLSNCIHEYLVGACGRHAGMGGWLGQMMSRLAGSRVFGSHRAPGSAIICCGRPLLISPTS